MPPSGLLSPRFVMGKIFSRMRISTYHNLITTVVFILTAVLLVLIVHQGLKQDALREARDKARIILDRNLAIHTYFSHDLKPKVFELSDRVSSPDYFEPAWMSSTYAVRKIDGYFRQTSAEEQGYYYKECAINARSPQNEADGYEHAFIEKLNATPDLIERSEVRLLDGKPYFVVMRRGETLEEGCLRCHSTPDQAPGNLVRTYGKDRSFQRNVGEVVSAISIRIPLASAYANADRITILLSSLLLALIGILYAVHYAAGRWLVFLPLGRVRDKAVQIASDERHLGESIEQPWGRELQDLTGAFNAMSLSLRDSRLHLEDLVKIRTAELQKALDNVRKLSGMLPICSSCKKVRDDAGYWKQIEVYIRDHSEAQFSHGICPDCAAKLYPQYYQEDK